MGWRVEETDTQTRHSLTKGLGFTLTKSLRLLVMAVILTAITVVWVALTTWPLQASIGWARGPASSSGDSLVGLAFWTAVTLLASSFPVRTPRGSLVSVSMAPILAAGFLGGPLAAVVVAGLGTTEVRELRLNVPWYGVLYNHATAVIPAALAAILYGFIVGFGVLPLTPPTLAAVLVAGVAYLAVNESLAAVAVAVRDGRAFQAVLATDLRAYGLALLGLSPLSWLMAIGYTVPEVGPLVVLVFGVPLYTTRAAYQSVVEIRRMFTQTVLALASAIDARDPSTKRHSQHVSGIAMEIGVELGVGEAQLEQLEWGGLLHDIGKIGVRDAVLLKPDRLNREERMLMNEHPAKGEEILRGVEKLKPELPLIRHHHEWYNGSGYPDKLIGEEIPFLARILHVADAFEAMTAVRPYRLRPLTTAQALAELEKYAGIQFDPIVVKAFRRTKSAQEGGVFTSDPPPPTHIPMIGDLASRRSEAPVSAAVPADSH